MSEGVGARGWVQMRQFAAGVRVHLRQVGGVAAVQRVVAVVAEMAWEDDGGECEWQLASSGGGRRQRRGSGSGVRRSAEESERKSAQQQEDGKSGVVTLAVIRQQRVRRELRYDGGVEQQQAEGGS